MLHDSISTTTYEDERRQISKLIVAFLAKVIIAGYIQ
jgi:hypothetical protein